MSCEVTEKLMRKLERGGREEARRRVTSAYMKGTRMKCLMADDQIAFKQNNV